MDLQNHDNKNANNSDQADEGMQHGRTSATRTNHLTANLTTITSTHIPPTPNRLAGGNVIIPYSTRNTGSPISDTLQCCCGRRDCAYLKHNNVALGDLEKDLETAARLGQALLQRHETYVSDAEADRNRMLLEMERLERDKREIQSANARIVEENRHLLEQLETLNNAVATSDNEIRSLADRLQQAQLEMRALAASAARAADLEIQLNAMEAEQMELQQQLILTQEDEKSAVQRWKKAETTLRDLQDQLDRLEYEARMEREEHAQIIERMERRRAVERELDSAAGRLKGAAAASAVMDRNSNRNATTPVVSKFVRDILQDNANLQMGIVELRELLESSNQEVENLREQILHHHHHQPVENDSEQPQQNASRLDQELNAKESRPISQEFHVHHHYHSPSSSVSSKKEKQPIRRAKKRRPPLMASGMHSPRSPSSYHHAHPSSSSVSTIMSQTSVSIPPSSSQRYSVHPSGVSSLASSPISAYQPSSIFDVVDQSELSRPSSPESPAMLMSPKRPMWRGKRMSDASSRSFSMPSGMSLAGDSDFGENDKFDMLDGDEDIFEQPTKTSDEMWLPPAIPEEQEDVTDKSDNQPAKEEQTGDAPGPSIINNVFDETTFDPMQQHHTLRKSASYESLLSVSGMDIHTLRDRPSQLLAGFESRYFLPRRPPQRVVTVATEISSPVISTTNITADKTTILSTSSQQKSSHSLLARVAAKSSISAINPETTNTPPSNTASTPIPTNTKPTTITRKVGGWVMGKWGIAPTPATSSSSSSSSFSSWTNSHHLIHQAQQSDAASISSSDTATTSTTTTQTKTRPHSKPVMRGFGINQKGPIPGFVSSTALPAKNVVIHADVLDRELLDESLKE
ncbi:conserved hypothetical protein [Talaromyces stipitatus ATCC 10500]|uniref:Uncharacterized protein n=1 Tax=Talaromyces stipitatus (strain ATCC 10500 / CBS 375.48 / QM 6759 / NRRL 1006) TaxID=441959 RepID=B8MU13_TALSN|nr:uncharacterized protein TSTA_006650 [Talaromyces stipitatus ATCC 10500]EED12646.1 conserved hypothetical protein [Talaromyces stipitatus ATCC 10500]